MPNSFTSRNGAALGVALTAGVTVACGGDVSVVETDEDAAV